MLPPLSDPVFMDPPLLELPPLEAEGSPLEEDEPGELDGMEGMEAPLEPPPPDPPELERDEEEEELGDPEEPDPDEPDELGELVGEGIPPEEDEDCCTQPPTRNADTAPTRVVCIASVRSRFNE